MILAAGSLRRPLPRAGRLGLIPVGIFTFYIAGSANEAAALGVILIAVAAMTPAINRIAGTRMGASSGDVCTKPRRDPSLISLAG